MYQALRSSGITPEANYPGQYNGLRQPSFIKARSELNFQWFEKICEEIRGWVTFRLPTSDFRLPTSATSAKASAAKGLLTSDVRLLTSDFSGLYLLLHKKIYVQ